MLHSCRWQYAGEYRRCMLCSKLQYHSSYEIGGSSNERWIDVGDIPEAINEFLSLSNSTEEDRTWEDTSEGDWSRSF